MKRIVIWIRHGFLVLEWFLSIAWGMISWMLLRRHPNPIFDCYNSLQFPGGFSILGRVLDDKPLRPPKKEDSKWVNFKRMLRQWMTRELPYAEVQITANNKVHKLTADEEGFIHLTVKTDSPPDAVMITLPKLQFERRFPLIKTPENPSHIVISDIDDTLMETGAISLKEMVKTTLLGNSLTRELVKGTPELLQSLHKDGQSPVFYVTSSPWNLCNFLKRVFQRAHFPDGGLFMTNWGLTPEQWLTPSHDKHKREAIDQVLNWYPESKALLLGDDSQKDPEIYARALEDYGPSRIANIFIRNVSGDQRANEVKTRFGKLNQEHGTTAHLIKTTEEIRQRL